MPHRTSLAHSRERHVIAKLFIDLTNEMRKSLVSEKIPKRDTSVGTLLQVGAAIVVGHAEGRPMTVTKIAHYVDLPRSTVQRKLEQLLALGIIVRRGNAYFISQSRASDVSPDYVKRSVRIITEAAKRLAREV